MTGFTLEHSSSSSDRASDRRGRTPLLVAAVLVALILVTMIWMAVEPSWPRPSSSDGPTVDGLASPEGFPYLVLDLARQRISVVMSGVRLRDYGFDILADTAELQDFDRRWEDTSSGSRSIEHVYLTAAAEAVDRREISVIAEEFHLDPDLVQRYVPARLVLVTDDDLALLVETDCEEAHSRLCSQFRERLNRAWRSVTGGANLRIHVSSQDAMSLYGVALAKPRIVSR